MESLRGGHETGCTGVLDQDGHAHPAEQGGTAIHLPGVRAAAPLDVKGQGSNVKGAEDAATV